MDHAAAAGEAGELFCCALVVIQHHQLGGTPVNVAQYFQRERKIENVDGAPGQIGQVGNRLDVAMVQSQEFSLASIK